MIDNKFINVLFTNKFSIYDILNCNTYNEDRNALTFSKNIPAIYHPPCRLFSRLKTFSKADKSEKELAFWSIEKVNKYGGLIEHPLGSSLFKESGIKLNDDNHIIIKLSNFGFEAEKKTIIYFNGIEKNELPLLPYNNRPVKKTIPQLSYKKRANTPFCCAIYLIELIKFMYIKNNINYL